jgi:hypothetical protein
MSQVSQAEDGVELEGLEKAREEAMAEALAMAGQLRVFMEEQLGLSVSFPGVKYGNLSRVEEVMDRVWEYGNHRGLRPSVLRKRLAGALEGAGVDVTASVEMPDLS